MKTIPLLVVSLLVAGNWVFAEQEPDLDDPKVREKILKEAVLYDDLVERGSDGEKLFCQAGKETPYTGWVKGFHGNGQVAKLGHYKEGKLEGHFKGGQKDGLWTVWDEDGKAVEQARYKDGKEVKE